MAQSHPVRLSQSHELADYRVQGADSIILVLTVDTEADNQWSHGVSLSTENVRYWEPFQRVCRGYGVAPTYLVTSEIAADPHAQSLLRAWIGEGEAEVGAHLHPWTTPPFRDEPGLRFNDQSHPFISELPDDLAYAKLESLTREIEEGMGVRPTSFRAGRYGISDATAIILAQLGYTVDTSVTPLTGWAAHTGLPGGAGGPDFSSHESKPFIIAGTGAQGLLEIPVTIVTTCALLRRYPNLRAPYHSLPARAVSKMTGRRYLNPQPVWLHPAHFEHSQRDLERAWDLQMKESGIAVMMLHSSELMPGGSRLTPTEESARMVLRRLERFLAYVQHRGGIGLTLSNAAAEVQASPWLEVHPLQGGR